MRTALIGYTGFVGGNILRQKKFSDLYNSKNIENIKSQSYDFIVCAAAPGVKWKANKNPDSDLEAINRLIKNLSFVKTKQFILVSTIDVYNNPNNVNENSIIDDDRLHPYGKHRLLLEKFIAKKFKNHVIIRLPALFGIGLKKNFIYDLIHSSNLELTNKDSQFQFYNLDTIWKDLEIASIHNLKLVNFATEPVLAKEVAVYIDDKKFNNETESKPALYDFKTLYAKTYGKTGSYLYSKNEILKEICAFILKEKIEYEVSSL